MYFLKDKYFKEYSHFIEKKADHFKSDSWVAFENEAGNKIYF